MHDKRSGTNLCERPSCGERVEADGSRCCLDCETTMFDLSEPRHQ